MIRAWFDASFGRKLIVTVLVVQAVFSALFALIMVSSQYAFIDNTIIHEAEHAEHILAAAAGHEWQEHGLPGMNDLVSRIADDPHLENVMFIDRQGRIIASADAALTGTQAGDDIRNAMIAADREGHSISRLDDGVIELLVPVAVENGVTAGYSLLQLDGDAWELSLTGVLPTTLSYFLGTIIIIGVIITVVVRAVNRRIADLTAAAESIARGDLNAHLPAPSGHDQVDRLTDALNRMTETLKCRVTERDNTASLLNSVLESVQDVIIVTDEDNVIRFVNTPAARLVGMKRDDLLGKPASVLSKLARSWMAEQDGYDEVLGVEAADPGVNTRILLAMKDGSYMERRRLPYKNERGKIIGRMVIVRDMTETVRASMEQSEQDRKMFQQSRLAAMGEMVGAIAHQWRQPLNTVGLYLQEIGEYFNHGMLDRNTIEQITERCMKQITYMSDTIEDFRNFYRPATERRVFVVTDAIEDTLSLVARQFSARGVNVMLSCGGTDTGDMAFHRRERADVAIYCATGSMDCADGCRDGGLRVKGHRNEFQQVILNIVTNSRDAILRANPAGGIIRIEVMRMNGDVMVSITDDGDGIPETIINRIFDPYFTSRPDDGGTGVGLYMAKTIIERNMGGNIRAENMSRGARIEIVLPAFTAEDKEDDVSPGANTPG